MSKKISPKAMAKLIAEKLSKEEYDRFAELVDGDPPAGPFYCAIQDQNILLNPETYYSDPDKIKKEVI